MQDRRNFLKSVAMASVGVALAPGEIIGKESGTAVPTEGALPLAPENSSETPVIDANDPVANKIRQARYVAAPSRV